MHPRQIKLQVSAFEREFVRAQQAVNRVQLYRPIYPFPFTLALRESNEFLPRFQWAMQQRAYERAVRAHESA